MTEKPSSETVWHLDKRVPVAIILALVTQSAAALVWAGAAGERLSVLEERTQDVTVMTVRTARLEEQVHYIRATLERIERKLDRTISETSDPARPERRR